MLKLNSDEKILLIVHKHWFVMLGTVVSGAVLLAFPFVIKALLPFIAKILDPRLLSPLENLFLSLYGMVLLLFLFLAWMDYYLDMWIVTTHRIIDVEQLGLFSRQISEIPLEHIQDVTLEVRGIIPTFLKFGTIRIQTAGEREFTMHMVPRLYEIKDAILVYAKKIKESHRA